MDAQADTEVQPIFTERKTCRACDSKTMVSVLDLGVQYLPRFVEEPDETLPKAPLHLVQCAMCGLLQLLHTTDPDLLYRQFWYRTGINATMRHAMDDLVESALEFADEGTWLDIGANDGYLLSKVPTTFTKIACEPAINFEDQLQEHANVVIPEYFSLLNIRDRYEGPCDIITSAACFYDVDKPDDFVRDISKLLSDEGVWINQLNDSPTMLKRNAFDSICHEHLCYYDIPSLNTLYRKHGLRINQISHNEVNGGSVRIFSSKMGARLELPMVGMPTATQQMAQGFAERTKRWKDQVSSLLKFSDLFRYTPVYLYGASTKGGTLLQYLDCDDTFLACADRNAQKWGKRMVGSWVPIINEAEFRKAKPKFAMVLPWAFREEFLKRERDLMDSGTTLLFPLPNFEMCM